MKGLLIYHSLSGNTRAIAQSIYRGMCKSNWECAIAEIKDVYPPDLQNYDLIGIGSPVLHHRELMNITNFIEYAMEAVDGKHGFAFCTHGAMPGHYLSRVVPALKQRGMTVIGWNNWFCSVNYPAIPKPYFTDGHPDEIDLREAEDFGREIVQRSTRIYQGELHLIPVFPTGKEYDEIYDPLPPPPPEACEEFYLRHFGQKFTVDKNKCKYPKCSICIDNCPMQSINFKVSPPSFDVNCDRCFLCEQICPNGAIVYDWEPYVKAHLPMIPALEQSLELFEKRGRFRRLIPSEKIGWDTFFWKNKQPRFKIK